MREKFPLLGPVLEHVNYGGERMAMTAEILTVVTYDGFSTRSQPILYSSPSVSPPYLIFQIKGEPTFTEDERRGEIL